MIGAYKNLDRKDVYLSEYITHKQWTMWNSEFKNYGVSKVYAVSGSLPCYLDVVDKQPTYSWTTGSTYYPRLAYESVKNSFYEGSTGEGTFSGNRDLDLQTGVTVYGSRNIHNNNILMYSIPRECIGNRIEKGTVKLMCSSSTLVLTDLEGILVSGSTPVGDVIYDKGLLIVTEETVVEKFKVARDEYIEYRSELPIYTCNVNCSVKDLEFNYTNNPTVSKELFGNPDFTPYVTSVGLYNNNHELVAVAKLSKPVKKASNVDTTFNVRIDIG